MQVNVFSPGRQKNKSYLTCSGESYLTCSGEDLVFVVRLALLVIRSLYIQNRG